MQPPTGTNPEIVEQYLDIYQALDTMSEDTEALAATREALLADCTDDAEALATLNAEVARDLTRIDERRRHVLGYVIGRTALHGQSIRAASLAYVAGFESPEGQQDAAWRVSMYNAILELVWHRRAVPSVGPQVASRDPGQARWQDVRIYGHTDPVTGGTWVSLTDPRTVELPEPVLAEDKVLAEYTIISSRVNEAGETVAVIRPEGMPEREVVFPAESHVWRVNPAGNLELFIPRDRSSLAELEVARLGRLVDSINGVTRFAVSATGANVPNIGTTFEEPRGDPRPIPVAKQD